MEIVRASSKDIPTIQAIAEATWPEAFRDILEPEQIRYMLDKMYNTHVLTSTLQDPQQSFWLFRDDNIAYGFAGIEHHYKGEFSTKLHKLYVRPDAQGKQAGRRLIAHVQQEAVQAGSKRLLLNVNRYNKAIGFYEYLGFKILYAEDIDIGNGYLMEDYVMELHLL